MKKIIKKKKRAKKKSSSSSSGEDKSLPTGGKLSLSLSSSLLRRGNITLTRLLLTVNAAGNDGITTMKLFRELGSTGHGQTTLRRAVKQGLIARKQGEPPGPGQFPPVFNILTKKGKDLLLSQFIK